MENHRNEKKAVILHSFPSCSPQIASDFGILRIAVAATTRTRSAHRPDSVQNDPPSGNGGKRRGECSARNIARDERERRIGQPRTLNGGVKRPAPSAAARTLNGGVRRPAPSAAARTLNGGVRRPAPSARSAPSAGRPSANGATARGCRHLTVITAGCIPADRKETVQTVRSTVTNRWVTAPRRERCSGCHIHLAAILRLTVSLPPCTVGPRAARVRLCSGSG
jgi:hypothetical protein